MKAKEQARKVTEEAPTAKVRAQVDELMRTTCEGKEAAAAKVRAQVDEWMKATCEGEEAARAMVRAQVDEWMRATTTSADSTKAQGFVVDNALLQARSPGLGCRLLQLLDAKAPEKAHAPWGSTVQGALINQAWLQVGQQFLQTKLNVQVLRIASAVDGELKGSSRRRSCHS